MSTSNASRFRRVGRFAWKAAIVVAALLVVGLLAVYARLRSSLPQVDGTRQLAGLTHDVSVERDALGVPTVTGATRLDVSRALGFVHAQDRFFQMDLARRRAAGELSELIGEATVTLDRRARVSRLRARAVRAIESTTPDCRAELVAYADGVNAGLAALGAAPPEYLALRVTPRAWQPEDSVLVIGSMFQSLQDDEGRSERRLAATYRALPAQVADFFTSSASGWETPLVGEQIPVPPIPGPAVLDVRKTPPPPVASGGVSTPALSDIVRVLTPVADEDARGSNNWAVAGRLTADGGAIIANDMHLGLGVPNIWYRASLTWRDDRDRWVTGLTLPGVPWTITGSNGAVAWGFTNSTADWSDLVQIEVDPADAGRYRTPSGASSFAIVHEQILVKGRPPVTLDVRETIWGPVITDDEPDPGVPLALAWVPLRDGGLNLELARAERADTIEQLFAVAAAAGIPGQNLVAAQRDGRIGWTIAGRIPRRLGTVGRVPVSWADGTNGWDGWLSADAYPRVIDPASGRIVTANNRLVDGDALRVLGDGGYDPGARARQIREGLEGIDRATMAAMLAVHLDDRAVFLSRWRGLLINALSTAGDGAARPRRERLLTLVSEHWSGRAAVDSASYRIVREFRAKVSALAFAPLVARVRSVDPTFAPSNRGGEGPLWRLVSERPPHLLDPGFASWEALLVAAADAVAEVAEAGGAAADYTWGLANTARIAHPFSGINPVLGRWLDMPRHPLPGDSHMPRVQAPGFGASQRSAVSPGRESTGYQHMPTGQSGHPLSPHYRDAHAGWERGDHIPFLPGPPVNRLTLQPLR